MTEYTAGDLDIIESIDDGIAPHDWRNNSTWFEGKMVKPTTNDALNYCATNGTYFDTPNAYFVEGFEDGDCDCEVLCVGTVPSLGDLDQSQLRQIWEECFAHSSVDAATFTPRPEVEL